MNTIEYLKQRFNQSVPNGGNQLSHIQQDAFSNFNRMGIPTVKHEEWKYSRISGLFNREYKFPQDPLQNAVKASDLAALRLPGSEEANELFFINGIYSPEFSVIRSPQLAVTKLSEANEKEQAAFIKENLGHSSRYMKDGINALNTAFLQDGILIELVKGKTEHPVFIYNITDARAADIFSQPRSLFHVQSLAEAEIIETYITLGSFESLTNQVLEFVLEKDAHLHYYKIQDDAKHSNQVSTTHIRQKGKSFVHTVTISLNGNFVRNNLNVIMDAEGCESHLYGLYFMKGQSHVDNHTLVDNVLPNCYSNELFKGMMDDQATGVFNGKIYVRQDAQQTNAYQSNKNILLSENASVYTKPQLEIFADSVKCSHGCTVGRLDEEGLFYLRSRGISEKTAKSLLLHAYADDILEQIKIQPIREYVDRLISNRLEYDLI